MLAEVSFLMKHVPPVIISFSSRNHFTMNGAVPEYTDLKLTVDPGMTSWFSGLVMKTGGSKLHFKEKYVPYNSITITRS